MSELRCPSDLQVDDVKSEYEYISPKAKGKIRAKDINLGVVSILMTLRQQMRSSRDII